MVQNTFLVVCASTVAVMFVDWQSVSTLWSGKLLILLQIAVILTAAISQVASIGTKIVMQKDWIVVLADGDLNHLASRYGCVFYS